VSTALDSIGAWFGEINWIHFATIPLFTAIIGWLINWSGLIMLFSPVQFHGFRVPGLAQLSRVFPRRIQEVPGLLLGGIGWQGIVPMRAAKMGSIAVDKAISKLGTPRDFYQQLEPDKIAAHIVTVFEPDLPQVVEDIMRREHPRLWRDLPPWARQILMDRVQTQLPSVVKNVTDQIGEHIDQLLDPKVMVIDQFRKDPSLVVRIFRDFGARELKMMVNFGFIFGFLLGIPVAFIDQAFHQWWLLPIMGVLVGWATNSLGMWLIFEPPEPKKIGPFTFWGLFPRRQPEAAEVYADLTPARSSPSSTSATSCSTARVVTAPAGCWPTRCDPRSTGRSAPSGRRCGSRSARPGSTTSGSRWPRRPSYARSRRFATRSSAGCRPTGSAS